MQAKTILFVVLVLLCGAAVYFVTQNSPGSPSAGAKVFNIRIEDKRIVEGDALLRADEGDTVTINLTSDEAEEFHLHGYDRSVDLVPDTRESLVFVADASGRFPFELELSKTELGAIEVSP